MHEKKRTSYKEIMAIILFMWFLQTVHEVLLW
jgi:hypothetical protein